MPSSIPAAYTALSALAASVLDPDVQVSEGQVGAYIAGRQLLLADADGDDRPLTIGVPTSYAEAFVITVVAHSWAGGTDTAGRRSDALSIYEAIRDGINADRSLGQPQPFTANVGHYAVAAGFDENGVSAQVTFTVAFTNVTT